MNVNRSVKTKIASNYWRYSSLKPTESVIRC